ncbi:MAG: histidine phosphatase family protein [Alphaproteobacteria bacterium]
MDAVSPLAREFSHMGRPKTVYVVRHGRSLWNGTKKISGQLEPGLSSDGKAQAQRLGRVLRDVRLDAVYTSTLRRAVETAQPVSLLHGLEIQQCAALREQHMGVVQGRFRDHRDPEALWLWNWRGADRLHRRLPDGESFADLEARVLPCLDEILRREAGKVVLIVGHRNTNRVVLGRLLGWPREDALEARVRACHLYEIAPGGVPRVETISLRRRDSGKRRQGFWQ